jgi:hypothetical protein
MINGRIYHSGRLVAESPEGKPLSDDEIEHLWSLESLAFTFEGNE